MKKLTLIIILFTIVGKVYSQQKIGNNPTSINANAVLEIESTNKGLLIPRIALTSTSSASPLSAFVAGMMVYNTATAGDVIPGFYVSTGSSWSKIDNQTSTTLYNGNGTLSGNRTVTMGTNTLSFPSTATTGTSHFTVDGTTLNIDAVNNRIGIGTATPTQTLDVAGTARFDGGALIQSFTNGTWINLPTTGPSGIGSGGAGANAWIGYAQSNGQWFNDAAAGDIAYRNTGGKLLWGNVSTGAAMALSSNNLGIGTLSPSEKLHVVGNIRASSLAGTGSRMVVADANGTMSTTAIPTSTTYTGSTSVTLNGTSFERAALTGDVTATANSNATTIATNAVTSAKILDGTIATADIADNSITKNKLENNIAIPGTANMTLPGGTTAERPVSPSAGMIRYNSTIGKTEVYQGGTWVTLDAASTYTASNGLTMASNNVKLGGTLTDASTSVNLGTNKFNFASNASSGSGHFEIDGSTFSVDAALNRVGFGTSTPSSIVHNYNNSIAVNETIENALANNYSMTSYKASAKEFRIGTGGGTESFYGVANDFFIFDVNNTTMRLVIDATGNVGIGTTAPDTQLDVPNGVIKAGTTASYQVRTGAGYIDFYDNTGVKTSNIALNNTNGNLYINGLAGGKNTLFNHNNTGKVGIGNTAPTEKLDVTGNVKFSGALMPNNTAGTAGQVLTSAGAGAVPTWTTLSSSSTLYAADGSLAGNRAVSQGTNTLAFNSTATTGTSHFTVDGSTLNVDAANNRVGFGTTAPNSTLSVNGKGQFGDNTMTITDGNDDIYLEKNSSFTQIHMVNTDLTNPDMNAFISMNRTGFYSHGGSLGSSTPGLNVWTSSAHPIRFSTNSTERMTITSAGNVGVGTMSPSEKLDVSGNVRFSGALMPNNTAGTSGQVLTSAGAGAVPTWTTLTTPTTYTGSTSVTLNGTSFERAALTGDVNAAANGNATTIANDAVTYAKMQNVSTNNRLLGRATTGAGDMEEITLGTGLSFSGTTLNAATGNTIYTANGTLSSNRIVTQGANTLAFTSTASHGFSVDGTTFSVDAANDRIGIGTTGPLSPLEVYNGTTNASIIRISSAGGSGNASGLHFSPWGGRPSAGAKIEGVDDGGGGAYMKFSTINDGTSAAAERLRINSNGNVGIGTTNPTEKTHINGGNLLIVDNLGNGGWIKAYDDHHSIYMREGANNVINYYEFGGTLASGSGHVFKTGGAKSSQSTRLQIADNGVFMSGNLGLGTTAPEEKIHINVSGSTALKVGAVGNANGALFLGGGGTSGVVNWIDFYNATGTKRGNIFFDQTNGFVINNTGSNTNIGGASGGKLGVNTVSPTSTLDVDGGILARGNNSVSNQGAHLQWNRSGNDGETWLLNQKGTGGSTTGIRFGSVTTANVHSEWARFIDNGNFGIGTISPSQKLHVQGNVVISGASYINETYINDAPLYLRGSGDFNHGLVMNTTVDGPWLFGNGGGTIGSKTGVNNIISWKSTGRVGINGVTDPTQVLDVNGGLVVRSNGTVSNQGAYLLWNRSGGDGETWILNQKGGGGAYSGIRFGSVTTSNVVTEFGRFEENGYFAFGSFHPAHPLHMSSGAHVTSAGTWTNASDLRLKTNVSNSKYGLKDVLKLRSVDYEMKANGEKQVGFIAQEVKKVIPEVVSGDENSETMMGISYGNLVPVLVNAIKEQQAQIEEMKKEIEELKKNKK